MLKLEIDGHHDQDHFIIVSNEHGSSSVPLHILWNGCNQFSYFSLGHHSSGDYNVTNKNGEEIEMYDGLYYCINETELIITALKERSGRE